MVYSAWQQRNGPGTGLDAFRVLARSLATRGRAADVAPIASTGIRNLVTQKPIPDAHEAERLVVGLVSLVFGQRIPVPLRRTDQPRLAATLPAI